MIDAVRGWFVGLAVLAGCDSIFGVRAVGGPPDAADAMTDAAILHGWKETAAGWLHSCGIRADDTLWCWGSNEANELGLGRASGVVEKPTQVSTDTFTELSSTYLYTCALGTDGAIRCWGDNTFGQLGTGNLTRGDVPRLVPGPWKHVSAGANTTCAIRDDNTLWCWGWNIYGQVGIGTTMQTPVPTQVGTATWLDVDVGWYHACGITSDHAMWCWGYEAYGEFGNGDDGGGNLSYVPKPGPPGSWNSVQAGAWMTCGITTASELRCWGLNNDGQVGDGTRLTRHTPQPVLIDGKDNPDWISMSMDHTSTCAIRQDGSMWCWGNDRKDQLGVAIDDTLGIAQTPLQTTQVSPVWRRVDIGLTHTCAISGDNELYCVGSTGRGQLSTGASNHPTPHAMPLTGLALALAGSSTCGLDSGGTIHCAGYNEYGQLGDGTLRSRDTPTTMTPAVPGVLVLAPGYGHTCASTASTTFCWGSNAQAQLGNGGTLDSAQPVMPTGAPPFAAMAAYNHTCGIDKTAAGSIYCWGDNDYGRDFANHSSAQALPQDVTGPCTSVAAGWYHTCAIGTNGLLYCWGGNQFGQLGQGDGAFRGTAVVVGSATWKSIATGLGHTCGVHSDGTLWCWGRNTRGQLGLGSYDDRYVPGQVGQDSDWRAVYAGDEHTCGVKTTGQVLCWGGNEEGQTPDATAWTATMVRVP